MKTAPEPYPCLRWLASLGGPHIGVMRESLALLAERDRLARLLADTDERAARRLRMAKRAIDLAGRLLARAERAESIAADLEAKVLRLQDQLNEARARLAAERADHARERRMGEILGRGEG